MKNESSIKRTATQAFIASYPALQAWFEFTRLKLTQDRWWQASFLAAIVFLAFLSGRATVTVPGEMDSLLAEIRLEILLQQRKVDRLQNEHQGSVNALAARLAQLQVSSTRIDALGGRLAQMGQLSVDEFDFGQPVAVGGPADPATMSPAKEPELRQSIDWLGEKLRKQASQLDALESLMVNREFESSLTPSGWPVRKGWISSRYGQRNDPFTGERVSHHGLDFAGTRGSDVLSVANGVVVWAGSRSGYGKTVEIDHGNGYQTRYAHNEAIEVQPGDQVISGQVIGKMGSSGRASAPHVHFEVLKNGSSVNPSHFVGKLR